MKARAGVGAGAGQELRHNRALDSTDVGARAESGAGFEPMVGAGAGPAQKPRQESGPAPRRSQTETGACAGAVVGARVGAGAGVGDGQEPEQESGPGQEPGL